MSEIQIPEEAKTALWNAHIAYQGVTRQSESDWIDALLEAAVPILTSSRDMRIKELEGELAVAQKEADHRIPVEDYEDERERAESAERRYDAAAHALKFDDALGREAAHRALAEPLEQRIEELEGELKKTQGQRDRAEVRLEEAASDAESAEQRLEEEKQKRSDALQIMRDEWEPYPAEIARLRGQLEEARGALEHQPQSGEDWVKVAERVLADGDSTDKGSPLFAAVGIAVRQRDLLLGVIAAHQAEKAHGLTANMVHADDELYAAADVIEKTKEGADDAS